MKGASVSTLCAFADFAMVEIGFTGKEQELNSGNSWAVQCEEQEVGDKMIVEVDITKYRVQPFKSYKVCISMEDPTSGSYLRRVCTHLFSFERAVPYVPTIKKTEEAVSAKLSTEKQSEESEREGESGNESEFGEKSENESDLRSQEEEERRGSELQRVLEDTRHFVRDDFSKVERALEEPFFNKGTNLGSGKGFFLALGIVLMLL